MLIQSIQQLYTKYLVNHNEVFLFDIHYDQGVNKHMSFNLSLVTGLLEKKTVRELIKQALGFAINRLRLDRSDTTNYGTTWHHHEPRHITFVVTFNCTALKNIWYNMNKFWIFQQEVGCNNLVRAEGWLTKNIKWRYFGFFGLLNLYVWKEIFFNSSALSDSKNVLVLFLLTNYLEKQ